MEGSFNGFLELFSLSFGEMEQTNATRRKIYATFYALFQNLSSSARVSSYFIDHLFLIKEAYWYEMHVYLVTNVYVFSY